MPDLFARLQSALGDIYLLEKELRGGGMSRVFLATEASLHRQVVIKLLPPEFASDVSEARFRQEMELAAGLQHPNILPVLSAGAKDDLLYYVMPYVAGESLRHRLKAEGRLPVADAVRLLHELGDALAHAHAQGVIHRDVKPENILLAGAHGVLTDFGVARALLGARSEGRLTETGMTVGTPGYMSPEQVAGERNVDARADIYALAVVGYEMLAGAPPFEGPTAQAVLAAHLTEAPRPVHEIRAETPRSVSAALGKALAKDPGDRFQSAAKFRDALAPELLRRPRQPLGGRWAVAAAAGVALLVLAASVIARSKARGPLDSNLLAVAPFDVLDPKLELWREGLVDVLSRNLDGAGPIRTVSPTVVIRRWSGRADPVSAAELGRRTGARLALFGQLVSTGADSVRLKATLLDVATGRPIGDVELRDQSAKMDRLADSGTVALLRELGRTRPIGAVRLGSLGSASLPAMKAFLQGEQFFRRTAWDSSIAYYQRALAQDSGFALALRRMSTALGWQRVGTDSLSRAYSLRAGALNHGLGTRDSLLVLADSLSAVAFGYEGDLAWWRRVRRLLGTLEEATRRYPDDPEVWYALGDARFHFAVGPGVNLTLRQMFEAFDRSITLDSAFAPAYIHPVQIALMLSDAGAARRYAERYAALTPTDVEGSGIRLVAALLDPAQARSAETTHLLDTASADLLANARVALRDWPDSAETQVRLDRLLASGRRGSYAPFTDSVAQQRALVRGLASRGHVHEAYRIGGSRMDPRTFAELAQLGVIPPDSTAAQFARWLRTGLSPAASALPTWAARGDTGSLTQFARKADSVIGAAASPVSRDQARYTAASARAYLALARRDTSDAIRRFEAAPDSMCALCAWTDSRQKATLLAARGRDREAAVLLEYRQDYFSPLDPGLRALERGRVHERLGDRAKAIEAYGYVIDVWRTADPELQPFVNEAKAALQRLGREPRR